MQEAAALYLVTVDATALGSEWLVGGGVDLQETLLKQRLNGKENSNGDYRGYKCLDMRKVGMEEEDTIREGRGKKRWRIKKMKTT